MVEDEGEAVGYCGGSGGVAVMRGEVRGMVERETRCRLAVLCLRCWAIARPRPREAPVSRITGSVEGIVVTVVMVGETVMSGGCQGHGA